jgi:hypothetical protein
MLSVEYVAKESSDKVYSEIVVTYMDNSISIPVIGERINDNSTEQLVSAINNTIDTILKL